MNGKMWTQIAAIEGEWKRVNGPFPAARRIDMTVRPLTAAQIAVLRNALPPEIEAEVRRQAQMQSDHEWMLGSDASPRFVDPLTFDEGEG